jgi:hypothetical protein
MAAHADACGHPSRLAQEGEHLRMTAAFDGDLPQAAARRFNTIGGRTDISSLT